MALISAGLMFKRHRTLRRLYRVLKPLLKARSEPGRAARDRARRESWYGVVHHVGRRSGIPRETLIEPFFTRDGALMLLAFESTADWCRNILSAGGCTLAFSGGEYLLTEPTVVSSDVAEEQRPEELARARNASVQHNQSFRVVSPGDTRLNPTSPAKPRVV